MPRLTLQRLPAGAMIAIGFLFLPVIGWFDYYTGPYVSFSIFYLPPIAVVAWYGGKWFGLLASLEGAIVWFLADYCGGVSLSIALHIWNAFVRFAIFLISALFVRSVRLQIKGLQNNLNQKTREVETFHRLLPLCSHCRRIRDEKGEWHQLEVYIREQTNMEFSHTICPDYAEKHHGEHLKDKRV